MATAKKKNKGGRPKKYSNAIAAEICTWIVQGKSLKSYCEQEGTPAESTVYLWLSENKQFLELYAQAREDQADRFVDEMIDIADNEVFEKVIRNDKLVEHEGKPVVQITKEGVNHARLRIDTRKWVASKLKAKKYGNKTDINLGAETPEGCGVLLIPGIANPEDWEKHAKQADHDLSMKEKEFEQKNASSSTETE